MAKKTSITIKAYALVWHDAGTPHIDFADAHVFNECPSVEQTNALAVYKQLKDTPIGRTRVRDGEYEIVPCTITYKI